MMRRVQLLSVLLACADAGGQGVTNPSSCAGEDCEEAGLLQGLQRRSQRSGPCMSSEGCPRPGATRWTLLNPNPDVLEWKFKGYYWYGKVPAGAADAGLCTFGALKPACTEKQKQYFKSKYDLAEEDFRMTLVGYLTVPLEYDEMKPSSKIALKLRISTLLGPAGVDAPLLLKHCGGPGSDDTCLVWGGDDPAIGQAYTWVGIQQRGVSSPSSAGYYPSPEQPVDIVGKTFDGVCEGTRNFEPPKDKDKEYGLEDFTTCVCDVSKGQSMSVPAPFPDPEEEDEIRSWFAFSGARDRACYKADYWKIGAGNDTYNFLDFVGTHLLAMDLDRFREAVGHEKLNIYGLSYGTAVGSNYVGAFPQNTGRVVLNGVVSPGPGVDDYYESQAIASRQCMTKLVTICNRQSSFLPEETLKKCQVPDPDPLAFFFDVIERIKGNATGSSPSVYSSETWSGKSFMLTPAMVYHYLARLSSPGQKAWVDSLITIVQLGSHNVTEIKLGTVTIFNQACEKYWYEYNYCLPGMAGANGGNTLSTRAVRAADYTNRFTTTGAMDTYRRLKRNYHPMEVYFATSKAGFGLLTWPADPTPGVFGFRAGVSPLIIASLYDMMTPFANAKMMREGFPDGALMTWQGVGHTVSSADYDPDGVKSCMDRVTKYLITGELPPDGFTCRQTQYIKAAVEQ